MTSSAPGEGRGREPSPSGGAGSAAEPDGLPPDLEDFLVRLGKSLQRHGLYPTGHPALAPVLDDLLDALEAALDERDRISLGVSPERLVHEEGESRSEHPLLSSLAGRLHEHHVSRLTFLPGPGHEEISAFLGELAHPPESTDEALGRRRELTDDWARILVQPVRYEALSMVEQSSVAQPGAEESEGEAEDLWLGLARAVLAEEALEHVDADATSLDTVVASLSEVTADRARARAVAVRMVALADTLARDEPEEAGAVRERFAELLRRADPRDLGRVLAAAPPEMRRSFVDATVDWLSAGSVVELLAELSDGRDLDVSFQMLRLLSKLASYADLDVEGLDPEASSAFRDQLRRLVTGWRREVTASAPESDGGSAGAGSDGGSPGPGPLSGPTVPVLPEHRSFVDPARVLRTALEVGSLGPVGRDAVTEMVRKDRVRELMELVREAPGNEVPDGVWESIDPQPAVRRLLALSPPDFEAVDALLERRGGVAGPLLDVLSESQSRSVRRQLFSRLAELEGEDVTEAILDRLSDERWFVKRNMLALLGERGDPPDRFAPLPYTRHSRAEVRKEAYKLAFRSPADRAEAVRRALDDPDRKALSLGMGALRSMPADVVDDVVPQLRERLEEGDLPPRIARRAVRELGRSRSEAALETLLEICRDRKVWRFWAVDLADKSALVLEALRTLARCWADRPEARSVLQRARSSNDPEIRDAARADSEAA